MNTVLTLFIRPFINTAASALWKDFLCTSSALHWGNDSTGAMTLSDPVKDSRSSNVQREIVFMGENGLEKLKRLLRLI